MARKKATDEAVKLELFNRDDLSKLGTDLYIALGLLKNVTFKPKPYSPVVDQEARRNEAVKSIERILRSVNYVRLWMPAEEKNELPENV